MSFKSMVADRHSDVRGFANAARDKKLADAAAQAASIAEKEAAAKAAAEGAQKLAMGKQVDMTFFAYTYAAPSEAERDFWVGALGAGVQVEQMARLLTSTPEYAALHQGKTKALMINATVESLFGRTATGEEVHAWAQTDEALLPLKIAFSAKGQDVQVMAMRQSTANDLDALVEQPTTATFAEKLAALSLVTAQPKSAVKAIEAFKAAMVVAEPEPADGLPPQAEGAVRVDQYLSLRFSEDINWASLDKNGDKVLAFGEEVMIGVQGVVADDGFLKGSLGSGSKVLSAQGNHMLIELGANAVIGQSITLIGVPDMAGNTADLVFSLE